MFFFFPGFLPVAYSCITTKTSKKEIKVQGFENWIVSTAAYKSLISSLPQLADNEEATDYQGFHFYKLNMEADPLDKKNIGNGELPNLFFDVVSSHNKNRLRLNWLIDESPTTCIYINDINVLGDSIPEIVSIYERCLSKGKAICVVDNKRPERVSEYSLADISGTAFSLDKQREIIDSLASIKDSNSNIIKNARGTNKLMLSQDFWIAYFLFEVTMEIPQDIAVVISGMSKNSFITKCLEIEEMYDQQTIRIGTQFYTYEQLLAKTFEVKGLNPSDFYNKPKRLGALPESESTTFSELRDYMTQLEEKTTDVKNLQESLLTYCNDNKLPRMLYFNYKRYCVKQDNPSKKTFSQFFNYDNNKIEAYENFKKHMTEAAKLLGKKYTDNMAKEFLLPLYRFDI